ncbi:MAG: ATP-binding protein [Pseudomonadota bacterium]
MQFGPKGLLLAGVSLAAMSPAAAATPFGDVALDPLLVGAAGAVTLAVAAIAWAFRVAADTRHQSVKWSNRLGEIEARLEKADAVLSAHPGLVFVWEDDNASLDQSWGAPKILGGPAALASLLSFSKDPADDKSRAEPPVERVLESLGGLIVEDGDPKAAESLKEKVLELRRHGIAFSGAVVTPDGRPIEVDGRVAGGQAALWLTDPAVRMAEDGSIMGAFHERAMDLHGSHALLERSPLPAWRRDNEFALQWVNRAYVDMVEASSAADVIKQQLELDPSAKNLATDASAAKKPAEGRIVVNSRGERRVLRVVETPLSETGEAALGGFAIDATELDKARGDLRQHIEANQRTLDQIQSPVAIFGASQNLIYNNTAFQDLWGLDDADLNGRTYHGEILDQLRIQEKLPEPPDYAAWRTAQLSLYTENLAAPGTERDGDAPDEVWRLPDGRVLHVAKKRHPLGGVMIAFEDITEKVSLEAKFNTQIKVQKATLNNLAEGVAVFGADGGLRLHNEAFEKLWRIEAGGLDANPHIDSVALRLEEKTLDAEDGLSRIKRAVTSKAQEDRVSVVGSELSLRDGRTVAFGAEPLPDGATLVHFLDVTDSREREKELKERNAILENADRLKSKFVDHVSYQLRTPLSTIIGFSEMLDGQMFGMLNDRQKDYVASVLSASYHLRDLINDIIDLAAIDAGKLEIDRKPADIRGLLEHAATFAALKAEDTQVALKLECPKDIGAIDIDERRIKQVLFNLLSNAFAYTGAGGAVTLGAERSDGAVKIWVADTGRGISATDQAKVFDAFESRGPSAGAGLGLSLVEKFVRLHGGWVKMDSVAGAGARVTFHLPEKASDAIAAQGAQPAQDTADGTADLGTEQAASTSRSAKPAKKPAAKKRVRRKRATPRSAAEKDTTAQPAPAAE